MHRCNRISVPIQLPCHCVVAGGGRGLSAKTILVVRRYAGFAEDAGQVEIACKRLLSAGVDLSSRVFRDQMEGSGCWRGLAETVDVGVR